MNGIKEYGNVKGNVMTIGHFVDFYMLEAMRAGISMAKSANPDNLFRRSFEKLEFDVNEAFDYLSATMSYRIYVYLWGAALGEAMYAYENCDYMIDEVSEGNWGYSQTFNYFPTEHNVEMVKDVFGQYWCSGGYGGRKWREIVEGMDLYGKITNAAFIDHAVDLEHNGGCVFDKTSERPFLLNCYHESFSGSDLHSFLNHKFSGDILNETQRYTHRYNVSRKVLSLLTRYSNIVTKINAPEFCNATLEWLSPYEVTWKDDSYTNEFSWVKADGNRETCPHCGDKIDMDYVHIVNDKWYCDNCVDYCENCDEYVCKDDSQWMDGENQTWCDACAESYKSTCEECNLDFHSDNTIYTEDSYTVCEKCAKQCEHCNEYYFDMESHNEEEHNEPKEIENQPLPFDADGIHEIIDDYSWIPQVKKNDVPYNVAQKQVKAVHENTVTMIVYEIGNLFIFDLDKYYKLSHSTKYDSAKYAIMTPCGLWFKHNEGSFVASVQTAIAANKILDWSKIQTVNDWQKVDNATISEIRNLTTMEVK